MYARPWWLLPLLVGVSVVALTACRGGDGDGTATPAGTADAASDSGSDTPTADPGAASDGESINACGLVTEEEVALALGSEAAEGERSDYPPMYSCRFTSESGNQLDVSVLVYPDADAAKALHEQALETNDYPEIDGLGDRAYDSRPIGDVTAQKGKFEVSVDVLTEDDEADFRAAIELARKALDSLP